MTPHSHGYAADMHSKSKELAAEIASAVSPAQISTSCSAVESFLSNHTPDQHRWFFSITFPTLICRIFGFDYPSHSTASSSPPYNGWIDVAVSGNDSELAGKIYTLLSPKGLMLSSIHEVDRLSLVKYVFPNERLPEWVQYMVQNKRDYSVMVSLCPLLKNRAKEDASKGNTFQIHLNVFEYYLFWFSYYPVCRGNNEESVKVQRPKKFKLENWTNSFPGLSSTKRGMEKKGEVNLYLRLLCSYLHSFVPVGDESMLPPYRTSLLQYASVNNSPAIDQAEFVVHTFMNFWLLGNDFSPVPVGLCKSFGVTSLISSLSKTTPTSKLAGVINSFVKYLNQASFPATTESSDVDCVGSFEWKFPNSFDHFISRNAVFGVHPVGSWISLIQRPLYRFVLRTFMFYPVETSITNASQAFTLWANYLEPWSSKFEEFSELDELLGTSTRKSAKDVVKSYPGYSPLWQGYVMSNYLFYSSLVLHFIGFAHKFLHTDTEAIVHMVVKIMTILTSTSQLMDLIRNVDVVYHSKATELRKSVQTALNSFIPTVRQQLQDWEYGLCESDADCSFLHDSWNKELRLFADGEEGGQHLLQLLVLRAEAELQSLTGNNVVQNLQLLDSLKSQINLLFGIPVTKLSSEALKSRYSQHQCHYIFNPRSFGSQMGVEKKYQGDSMKRPISNDEISWLVKLLVNLSCWVNASLGLNQIDSSREGGDFSYVEVQNGLRTVHGSVESVKVVLSSLLLWITRLGGAGVQYMRSHGLRVNLRFLALKKVMVLFVCFAAFSFLKKALAV